jgi:hypothetical protein
LRPAVRAVAQRSAFTDERLAFRIAGRRQWAAGPRIPNLWIKSPKWTINLFNLKHGKEKSARSVERPKWSANVRAGRRAQLSANEDGGFGWDAEVPEPYGSVRAR